VADYPTHPELEGRSFAFRDYFKEAAGTHHAGLSEPYVSIHTGMPVITFSVPVPGDDGAVKYVLCGSVNLLSPWGLGDQRKRRIGNEGFCFILDSAGTVILHPDGAKVLKPLPLGRNLDKLLNGSHGAVGNITEWGAPLIAAAHRVDPPGWTVLAVVPAAEVADFLREGLFSMGIFFCASLAVVLPGGLFLMRRITLPLDGLERAARIIAGDLRKPEGALTRPFASSALDALRSMRSNDEIGRLARAFFQLSVRLKQTLASLRLAAQDWERTFSSIQEAVFVLDADGRILRMNRAALDLLRSTESDCTGRHWRDVLRDGHPAPAGWPSGDVLRQSGRFKACTVIPGVGGLFELTFSAVQGRRDARGYLLTVTDVTEKLKAEERIRTLAFHDALTGLPNRMLLADRLEQAVASAGRNGTQVGVLFIDLDEFKQVNDTFGHDAGDQVLRQTARRIQECLRGIDTLARYAGDEFVCVLTDLKEPGETVIVARRILDALAVPFGIGGGEAAIGASIGISLYPKDGDTMETLVSHADSAMYQAKGRGKNSFWLADTARREEGEELPRQ